VINELDALFNIDPHRRVPAEHPQTLRFIRLGTSGAIQGGIDPGAVVLSARAVGLDTLMHFYDTSAMRDRYLEQALLAFAEGRFTWPVIPYAFKQPGGLLDLMQASGWHQGITMTLPGFYGPQGRQLRGPCHDAQLWHALPAFRHEQLSITNFEMESSGIYGLATLLGHEALSVNLILANRHDGRFLSSYEKPLLSMIEKVLSKLPA
jgi:uridine phosphorylase